MDKYSQKLFLDNYNISAVNVTVSHQINKFEALLVSKISQQNKQTWIESSQIVYHVEIIYHSENFASQILDNILSFPK